MKNILLFTFTVIAIAYPRFAICQTNTIVKIIGKDTITATLPFNTRDTLRKKYIYYDKLPVFPGAVCPGDMDQYITAHLNYPADAKSKKIEGTVVVGFIIDKEGYVHDPKIIKHLYPSLDNEALRLVKNMPRWHPAIKDGISTDCQWAQYIEFKLQLK